MDDASKCQDIPKFIQNALEQLISIKSKTSSIDELNNDLKQIDKSVNDNIINFAKKCKEFIINLSTSINEISESYIESYNSFIKEVDKATCRSNSDRELTKSDTESLVEKDLNKNKLNNKLADDSGNNKSVKDNKCENVGTTSKKSKTRKNNDQSDTESVNTSVINSSVASEQINNDIDNVRMDKNHIQNSEDDRSLKNIDSDKENAEDASLKTKEKVNIKSSSNNKSDIEEKHSESNNESEPKMTRRKKKNQFKSKKSFNVDSDSDEIVSKNDTKVKNTRKKLNRSKKTISADTEDHVNKKKSTKQNSDSDSDKHSISNPLPELENNNKDTNNLIEKLPTEKKDSKLAEKRIEECKVVLEKFDINSSVISLNSKFDINSSVISLNSSTGDVAINQENDVELNNTESVTVTQKDDSEENKDEKQENEISNIEIKEEEKPKFGLIKCIDINKLLDPNKKPEESVIVLSSSESEEEKRIKKKRRSKQKAEEKLKNVECKQQNNKSKIQISDSESKEKEKTNSSEIEIRDSEHNSDEKNKNDKLNKNKKDSSDSENSIDDKRKKKNKLNKSKKNSDSENSSDENNKRKNSINKVKEISDSESSSDDKKRRTRFNRKKERLSSAKQKFEMFRIKRQKRASLHKKVEIIDSSSSGSDSDTSVAPKKEQLKSNTSQIKEKKIIKIDPNYDYKNDIKFKSECYVSLPRIPVEKLKEKYLQDKEDAEINRLTNMKSLKRTRQQKSATSSSDDEVKSVKKRNKRQQKKNESENSDSDANKSDESAIPADTTKEDDAPTIPEDFLESDGGSKKPSDSSDNEDKDDKKSKNKKSDKKDKGDKKSKSINEEVEENKNGKKSKSKSDSEENEDEKKDEKSDEENNGKMSDEDDENNKQNSKWRNDPLLKGKLSCSDSEDDQIRFRNKKNKIEEEIRSEPEEEAFFPKKSKTKKQMKRIARRLGSDVSSSEDEKEKDNKKSDSDKDFKASSESEEEQTKKKRRRIKRMKDSDDSSDGEEKKKRDKKKKEEEEEQSTRKKIRHVWSKSSLADTTKEAVKEEEERKKRIAERQKLYNEIYDNKLDLNAKVDKVILDFNEETKEELLSVHSDLVAKLKPHQAQGVQFMWTACFESLERAKNSEGSGCILAHCMGLGKTLQVITLIHTLLTNSDSTNVKTVLVVCPLSTVLNWVNEFKKWLDDLDGEQINVFDLVQYKQNYERLYQMQDWMKFGGVLVIGYDMFRNLSNSKGKRKSKKLLNGFTKVLLEPGPDLVICDEGHLLKNEKTGISIAMNRLRTKRRIVLTGTPLQNNLKEYFCMVQFVKPNLLGTYKEYLNRFVNPITNGQYTDSTPHDIQIMRRRAHVLHKMLDAVVERRDYNVLAPFLPPKHEYVLFISLTEVQIQLYKEYLTKYARNTQTKGVSFLFQDFQEFQRICIHPRVLLDKSNKDKLRKEMEDDDSEGSLKDFINDDDSDAETTPDDSSSEDGSGSEKKAPVVSVRKTRSKANDEDAEDSEPEILNDGEWWSKFCQGDVLENLKYSSKILLLFDILRQCEQIGDKLLVFSQSLFSLNLIEYFLAKVDEATQSGDTKALEQVCGHTGSWAIGLDYFRLDGSTSCDNRALWCKSFNNEANTRARLFLISTKAGGLGINLVAANRVVIFDVSWNPSFDIQSIYRVYRFGQTKPCYIYRFVTQGTMENKIYERQVTKQAISKRVIDEQQIDRHYNQNDLAELYAFNPGLEEERPTPLVPKDRLFADLLQNHPSIIFKYHEHNSLLENKADEGLNEEERQAAWEEFENEKKAPKFNLMQTMVRNGMYETLRILVQEDNNGWTPAQINNILPAIVQRISEQVSRQDYSMYRRVEERHEMRVMEQRRMQMFYQQYIQQLRNASGGAALTPADMSKLAQMFSAYNQNMMQQQPQPASSSTGVFRQGDAPPAQLVPPSAPRPHPAVSEVVELND